MIPDHILVSSGRSECPKRPFLSSDLPTSDDTALCLSAAFGCGSNSDEVFFTKFHLLSPNFTEFHAQYRRKLFLISQLRLKQHPERLRGIFLILKPLGSAAKSIQRPAKLRHFGPYRQNEKSSILHQTRIIRGCSAIFGFRMSRAFRPKKA